jgi:predicted ATPase
VCAVVADDEITATEVDDCVASLVAKSLVTADVGGAVPRYRLLETIRAYALEKLAENHEAEQAARRHAEFFRDLVAPATADSQSSLTIADMARFAREIDNVRAALAWAFSPVGDLALGVVLTAANTPVWIHLALMVECRERAERALDTIGPDSNVSAPLRMQLHFALGLSLIVTAGPAERTRMLLTEALEAAKILDDVDAQLRTLWALWVFLRNIGECHAAQSTAERFSRIALRTGDPADSMVSDRITGTTLLHGGKLREAQHHLEQVLERYVAPIDRRNAIWLRRDQRLLARAKLAHVLWLRGFVDQGAWQARLSIEEAQAADNQLEVCEYLRFAVYPVAFMCDDLVASEQAVATWIDLVTSLDATYYKILTRCLEGKLLIRRGEFGTGTVLLRTALDACEETGWTMCYPEFLGALAEGLAGLGQLAKALLTIDQGLANADRGGERWYVPELLRIKGELLLQDAGDQADSIAEDCFRRSLEVARQQGALFWELRAATSLARLWHDQARSKEAHELLAPVYDRFTEGFETADLRTTKSLIEEIS